jgi:hypothetical protein
LRQFCLPHVEGVFVNLLLLHHGGEGDLVVVEGDAVEVARLAFVLCVLFDDDLGQPIVRDEILPSNQLIEDIDGMEFFLGVGTVD